jgi:Na+/phosphate symporter
MERYLTALLTLTAGIGVFLVACTMMSSNLESAVSRRLKQLFSHTGQNSERVADHLINVAKTIRDLQ